MNLRPTITTGATPLTRIFLGVLAAAVLLTPIATQAGDWKGSEATEDGVLHVYNPAQGVDKPATIEMQEAWRIGGYEDDENIFGVIGTVLVDDAGTFYLLDAQLNEIRIHDAEGEWLRTIGREGEGPGEFRSAFGMLFLPNGNIGVLQVAPPRLVALTPDGEPADDFPLPEPEGDGFRAVLNIRQAGDKMALAYVFNQPSQEKFVQSNNLALVSSDGSSQTLLHSQSSTMDFASVLIAEKEWDNFRNRWNATPDGRIFTVRTFGEYEITVWNDEGELDRIIHREYDTHVRSQEQKDTLLELYKGFTRRIPLADIKYEIEDQHSAVQNLWGRPDGTMWVLTSRGANDLPDGVCAVFDVYDAKGRYLQEVTLKGDGDPQKDGYFFAGDYLLVVTDWINALMMLQGGGGGGTEEEAEAAEEVDPMEVICYRIGGAQAAMN